MREQNMRIFGREPSFFLAIIAAALQVAVTFGLPLSANQTTAINAVLLAVVGAVTAWMLRTDGQLAAMTGLAQAGLTLLLAFEVGFSVERTTAIMTFVTLAAGLFVRTQVTAPVPAVERPPSPR
jgi:hypothetical protein